MTTSTAPVTLAQHGAEDTAQALARLLRVPVSVGSVAVTDLSAVAAAHDVAIVAIAFDTTGALPGRLAIVVDDEVALLLIRRLTGGSASDGGIDAAATAVLAEVGNIAASAFLNGVARFVRQSCLPSIPRVERGAPAAWVAATFPGPALMVGAFHIEGRRLSIVCSVPST